MKRRALLVTLLLAVAPAVARAEPLLVFAAASLTDVLSELGEQWAARDGAPPPSFSFGGSSTLARQIEEGAPADLFVSADEAQVERLGKQRRILSDTRRDLVGNRLVLVVTAAGGARVATPADLAAPAVRVLALAQPDSVPAGVYARRYLESTGLWERIAGKVVPVESVRAALAAVESGNADAAFVYETDAAISSRVRIAFVVPAGEAPRIVYVAAIPAGAANEPEARRFLDYLASPEAAAVFRRYGFQPPPPAAP